MAQLSDNAKEILMSYKNDLRRGDLKKIAKDLQTDYRGDRGSIVAYMIEKNIPILEAMSYIPSNGIYGCNMPVISIPGNIKDIRNEGIGYCTCKEIILEEGVERLESNAITYNPSLEKIILPSSLTSLGSGCFAENPGLKEVFIPDSITVLPKGIFEGCSDNIVILANFREDKRNRLKCVESEREFYKNHLKWVRGE